MRQVVLIDEVGVALVDMRNLVIAAQHYADLVAKAWNCEPVTVSTTPSKGAWNIYLTERLRARTSKGHHNVDKATGLPFAWVSSASVGGKPYGTYLKEHITKPLVVGGVTMRPSRIRPAVYRDGIISIICDELGEMMIDPILKTFSAPDSMGRSWLVEISAHCYGKFFALTIAGKVCVFHDFTLPSYYDLNGKAPFTFNNALRAPFERTRTSYAYYLNASGQLVKII